MLLSSESEKEAAHPELEELLLLQTGELDRRRTSAIEQHLRGCSSCSAKLDAAENLYGRIARAGTRSIPVAEAPTNRNRAKALGIGLASGLVACFLIATGVEFTAPNPAEDLLDRAIAADVGVRGRWFHIARRYDACELGPPHEGNRVSGDRSLCAVVEASLRELGWGQQDLLSPRSLRSWRASLANKNDELQRYDGITDLTTTAPTGPLRLASLRIRTSDSVAVSGAYTFESEEGLLHFTVTETNRPTPEPGLRRSHSGRPERDLSRKQGASPSNALDRAEGRARLALHDLGLDATPFFEVARDDSAVVIRGIAPTAESRQDLREVLADHPAVRLSVQTEAEQQRDPQELPWRSFQGDGPPLAAEQLRALYPANTPERQEFQNTLDRLTREIVALSRNRQGLLDLANRQNSAADTAELERAASDTETRIAARTRAIAAALRPLLGELVPTSGSISPEAAQRLYTLVHDLVFLSRTGASLSLEESLLQVRTLLGPA